MPRETFYPLSEADIKLIQETYYHPPKGDQVERYKDVNEAQKEFLDTVLRAAPPSRERSLAITKMQEARMWANAAIALNE